MNKETTYLKMFPNCIPVLGKKQSIIYDLQRNQALNIPNDLYHFIQLFEKYTIHEIFKFCGVDNAEVVEEYIQFLLQHELLFYIDAEEKVLFPELNMEWKSPSKILNAIIEISETTYANFDKTIAYLTNLGCEYIYLKIKTPNTLKTIQVLTEKLSTSSIFSIVFEAKLKTQEHLEEYESLIENNKRIQTLFLFSQLDTAVKSKKIIVTPYEKFGDNKAVFFNTNLTLFTESKTYNTYFNRKVFIDGNGSIYNAPETTENFGNITDISLEKLENSIASEAFQKYWKINKDLLEECKDCALRYMCVDNRLPIKSKEGTYTFSSECDVKL